MIFSLDVRRARKGDCMLLHFGSRQKPGLVMIDGGPAQVYKPHLKPRLQEIKAARGLAADEPLDVDLLMVSHVDDDHIRGILDLAGELLDADREGRPPLVRIAGLWHNSFDAIIGRKPDELTAAMRSQFGAAAASGNGELADAEKAAVETAFAAAAAGIPPAARSEMVAGTLQVLASIEQGFRLRSAAEALDIPLNPKFGGKLIIAGKGKKDVSLGQGLSFTVVGPMQAEVEALRKKHNEWLKKLAKESKKPPAALAAYVDKSVPNLSSLVFLAKAGGKSMLLTGDARGDKILEGLELAGLVKKGGKLAVDLLKVPHHGSSNNIEKDFFRRIVADHYVFSGDGQHGNPEREALEMLAAARGDDGFTIHLTYPIDELDIERRKDWVKHAKGKKWSPAKQGLHAFFDAHPGLESRTRIVEDGAPHVIDLMTQVGY